MASGVPVGRPRAARRPSLRSVERGPARGFGRASFDSGPECVHPANPCSRASASCTSRSVRVGRGVRNARSRRRRASGSPAWSAPSQRLASFFRLSRLRAAGARGHGTFLRRARRPLSSGRRKAVRSDRYRWVGEFPCRGQEAPQCALPKVSATHGPLSSDGERRSPPQHGVWIEARCAPRGNGARQR